MGWCHILCDEVKQTQLLYELKVGSRIPVEGGWVCYIYSERLTVEARDERWRLGDKQRYRDFSSDINTNLTRIQHSGDKKKAEE